METVLINGAWRPARSVGAFQAENPATAETLPEQYPISDWADVDAALDAARFRLVIIQPNVTEQKSKNQMFINSGCGTKG